MMRQFICLATLVLFALAVRLSFGVGFGLNEDGQARASADENGRPDETEEKAEPKTDAKRDILPLRRFGKQKFHNGDIVSAFAYSPDGSLLVSAGSGDADTVTTALVWKVTPK